MPKVAEAPDNRVFPWKDWEAELRKSPTGALLFGTDDFGRMSPRRFREQARKEFRSLGVTVSVQGEEVLVALNA